MRDRTTLRLLILSNAIPESFRAGSLQLFRLLQHQEPERMHAVGARPHALSDTLQCTYVELQPAASSRLNLTRLARTKRSLEAVAMLGRIPDARVDAAVGDFEPDIVLSVFERFDYVDAAHRFCRRRNVPLAVIVHDRLESFECVYPPFAGSQRRRIGAVYRDAAVRFCISPEMAETLREVYGAEGTVLYPLRSDDLGPRPVEDSRTLKHPERLTIAYCGAMNYGYGGRLAEVMPELAGAGITVRVYAREAPPPMPGVTYAGSFRDVADLWAEVKRDCDAVWLPYSHDERLRVLYETHFPSKLPEYLALGMPTLITGPAYATGVRWATRHPDAALTIADADVSVIRQAFVALRDDGERRARLAQVASGGGAADFDPTRLRHDFFSALETAVARSRNSMAART